MQKNKEIKKWARRKELRSREKGCVTVWNGDYHNRCFFFDIFVGVCFVRKVNLNLKLVLSFLFGFDVLFLLAHLYVMIFSRIHFEHLVMINTQVDVMREA